MSSPDFEIFLALGVILFMVLSPVLAWPQTRRLTPIVLSFYILFLWLHWDIVAGNRMTYHDTAWNLEGWSAIIQQWVYSGEPLGWNPFIGAGQPFALYHNVLSSLPSVFFAWLFKSLGLPFDSTQNFKLIWTFGHLNICTGALLLFRLLYRDSWVCLLGMTTLLFGGLFFVELGQGVVIYVLSFLPYMLFFLINYYRERTWPPLLLFAVFLGMSVNYYIPTYMAYTLLMFLLAAWLAAGLREDVSVRAEVRSLGQTLRKQLWVIPPALLLMAATAGPMFFNYAEIQDYASPTRGYSTNDAKTTDYTHQKGVSVPWHAYSMLIHPRMTSMTDLHSAYYIGLIPCIAVVASLIVGGNRLFMILSLFLVVISAKDIFGLPLWEWLRGFLPLGDTLRHTFMFARLAAFFLLTVSLAGLLSLKSSGATPLRKILAVMLGAVFWAGLFWDEWTWNLQMKFMLAGMVLILFAASRWIPKAGAPVVCLAVLLAFHAYDLIDVTRKHPLPQSPFWGKFDYPRQYRMDPIVYPATWQVRPEESIPVPQYMKSTYNKEAIWANKFPDTMLWLQKDLTWFLLRQRFLDEEIAYANPFYHKNLELKQAEGNLFYALPAGNHADPEALVLPALKRILNLDRPLMQVTGMSGMPEKTGETGNAKTQQVWFSFSLEEGFSPDRLEIKSWPWLGSWKGGSVEVWQSENGRSWQFVQELKLEEAVPDKTHHYYTFALGQPVTQPFFKLVIDAAHISLFSSVQLAESGVKASQPVVEKGGTLIQSHNPGSNRVTVDLDLPSDAYLLRMENYHPGWTATVDGNAVPITRVSPNFQAVSVPAGQHTVEFEFRSLYPTLVILHIVTGLLGGAGLLWWLSGIRLPGVRAAMKDTAPEVSASS
ncbi:MULTISPECIES: YfhO family protein [unclassified Nitrospina]|uniref:YfhO family protein n=1 Tax=unclassified Nitrospina TaxID=2638683 RepID=UPI003F9934C0